MLRWLFKPAARTPFPAPQQGSADQLVAEGNCAEKEGRLLEACELYRTAVAAAPGWRESPLMDEVRFVRDLETAYRRMWQSWCSKAEELA